MAQGYLRISDFPMVSEVREDYVTLRTDGNDRKTATEKLIEQYHNEITTGAEDDGLFFWIGLADAQFSKKELTEESALKGLESLKALEEANYLSPADIKKRKERYVQAPMPERKIAKRKVFTCQWNIGDTFLLQLSGLYADTYGMSGKYMFLRKVGVVADNRNTIPVVSLHIWDGLEKPTSIEDFYKAPPLRLRSVRLRPEKMYLEPPPLKFQYRAQLVFNNQREVTNANLEYFGNFPNIEVYEDEFLMQPQTKIPLIFPKYIKENCSILYMDSKMIQENLEKTGDGLREPF